MSWYDQDRANTPYSSPKATEQKLDAGGNYVSPAAEQKPTDPIKNNSGIR